MSAVARRLRVAVVAPIMVHYDAISLAGDMGTFAARNKVVLIRHVKEGSKVYYLNLNSDKILNSDLYYLMPNDIIYVPPLKSKAPGI